MEQLFTPWRMNYIRAPKQEADCIFCRKPAETGHHQFILRRGPLTFTIQNVYPYTEGHLMVVPYRHLSRIGDLSEMEREELSNELALAEGILRRELNATRFHIGINLGRAAGAGVLGHIHAHLVPRDLEGATARVSQDLESIHARLRSRFD